MSKNEGEFKKRMTELFPDIYHDGVAVGHVFLSDLNDILDEAKKEFPEYGFGKGSEKACIDALNKIVVWKKKWFGEE